MVQYLFALILCLFYSIYSTKNNVKIRQNILSFEREENSFSNKSNIKNYKSYLTENKEDIKQKIIFIIELFSKSQGSDLKEMIRNFLNIYKNNFIEEIQKKFNQTNKVFMIDIIKDVLNESNTLLNDAIDIITNKNNSVSENLIKLLNQTELEITYTLKHLKNILEVPEVFQLYNNTYLKYKNYIINITEIIIYESKNENAIAIFDYFKGFLEKYKDDLYILFYDLFKLYEDRPGIADILKKFINNYTQNNITLFQDLKEIILNENMTKLLNTGLNIYGLNEFEEYLIKGILSEERLVNFIFRMIYEQDFVADIMEILKYLENKEYITPIIRSLCLKYIVNNKTNLDLILQISISFAKSLVKKSVFNNLLKEGIKELLKGSIETYTANLSIINEDCRNLILSTFMNESLKSDSNKDNKKVLDPNNYFIKKLIFESSLNKNDFLNYENCLSGNNTFSNIEQNQINIRPVYIISIIEESYNKTTHRNNIFYEKYNYLQSLCLPQGVNASTNKDICSEKDYTDLIYLFTQISFNIGNSTIRTKILDEKGIDIKPDDYKFSILILILFNLPLIIKLFLFIFLFIYRRAKNNTNSEIFNKLTTKEDKKNNNQEDGKIIRYENNNNQLETPKCYQILNRYFDIVNNLKELFNFSLTETEYNNVNRITYIKGILGISLFLNIIGQTFFILMNILHKTTTIYEFYNTIRNFFYIFIFVGLRYAPRLIFSCSGYTLAFKFLSFFYFFKVTNIYY